MHYNAISSEYMANWHTSPSLFLSLLCHYSTDPNIRRHRCKYLTTHRIVIIARWCLCRAPAAKAISRSVNKAFYGNETISWCRQAFAWMTTAPRRRWRQRWRQMPAIWAVRRGKTTKTTETIITTITVTVMETFTNPHTHIYIYTRTCIFICITAYLHICTLVPNVCLAINEFLMFLLAANRSSPHRWCTRTRWAR